MRRGTCLAIVFVACACAEGGTRQQLLDPSTGDDASVDPAMDGGTPTDPPDPSPMDDAGDSRDAEPPIDVGPIDAGTPPDAGAPPDSSVPPACAESPCRLLTPQCGCPSGEACYLDDDLNRVCDSAGTAAEGEECAGTGSCAAGLDCAYVGFTAFCHRFCATDADCTGDGSRCLIEFEESGGEAASYCTRDCDPIGQLGCPTGTACNVYLDDVSREGLTHCRAEGLGTQDDACLGNEDCAAGYVCSPGFFSYCSRWCATDGDCPSGTYCYAFPNELSVAGTEYGYCY